MKRIGNRVSYIRKPLSRYSFVSAGLLAAALLMTAAAVALSYRAAGDGPLLAAALGFCGILAAGSSAAYGVFSFFERETNTILAKICLGGAGILLVFWLAAVIAAL